MKRIAVFFDGSNCFYTQKSLGWSVDASKLLDYCRGFGDVVEAVYYSGAAKDVNQQKYYDKLAYIGYSLVTKPIKTFYDPVSCTTVQKANLDVDIVLDLFNMADRYDMAILISGDGDFERPIQQLKLKGKEVKVISTRGCVATELVHTVGINYIDWMSIRDQVERTVCPCTMQHEKENVA